MLYIFIVLPVLFILICPLSLFIYIHNNEITLNIKVFNLINFSIFKNKKIIDLDNEKVHKNKTKKKTKKFKGYRKEDFYNIAKKIKKFLKVSINFSFSFGFERKDLTALAYGVLSGVFPTLKIYLERKEYIEKLNYNFYPDFNKTFIDIKVTNNIKTNMFKVILIIFILLRENLYIRRRYKNKQKEC